MNEFYAAIVGAIIGSLSAGIVSWRLQISAFTQMEKARKRQLRNDRYALAMGLRYKVSQLSVNLAMVSLLINRGLTDRSTTGGQGSYLFLDIQSANFVQEPISIEPAEFALILMTGDERLFSDLCYVEHSQKSALSLMRQYNAKRSSLMTNHLWLSLPKPSLSDPRLPDALPDIVQVENLITRIIENADQNALDAEKIKNEIDIMVSNLTVKSVQN
jgi:hypothetical protein